ncbi:MAG TPA: hypothetical protein VFD92_04690 [Candidatus Binatia bacterium]|nr:hypothetical protein [Candidatus Binatia bacterium]
MIFGTLWSAAKATLETSHAFAAAKKAYDDGGGLPAIVSAWAAETSSAGDDLYATKVEAALRIVAGWVRSAAVLGVKAAIRVEHYVPAWVDRAEGGVAWLERTALRVRAGMNRLRTLVPPATAGARRVSSALSGVAAKLDRLRDGESR